MRLLFGSIIAGLLSLPIAAAPEAHTLARSDGSLIHYTLDHPAGAPAGLILLAQGSGCAPGASNAAIATIRSALPDYTALIVEKIGIVPGAAITDGYSDCPADFAHGYSFSQRVDDYYAVLAHLRLDPRFMDEPLVLFGGSEGGLAMAKLAAEIHPAATILLSSAIGTTFGEMVKSVVPPEGHPTIEAGFIAARAAPESMEMFLGSSYRFWADIVDVRPLDFMRQTSSPFLVLQGGRDSSNPVALARLVADTFAAEGRCNLTYWEFPTLDHGMRMPDGASRLAAVTALAAQWLAAPSLTC